MNVLAPARAHSLGAHPAASLAVVTLAGWLACALWTSLLRMLGLNDTGLWYLDSYAVLAALDAVRAGLDPNLANPLDPLLRNHKYSDWWFALRWLGLTREANFFVGTAWVGAFALTAWQTLKPRDWRETAWLAALLLSPPVLLAVNRANNDLVIFVLLAWCAVAAASPAWWRQLVAVGALALATGLKFYPAVAALAFLWVRPVRRMPGALILAVAAAAGALASVWPQMSRGQFKIGSALYEMGAPLLGRELGWSDPTSLVVCLLAIVLAAAVLVRLRCTVGLAARGDLKDRLPAALGVIVLLACFVVAVSFAYRWIFALGMALWLWRQAGDPTVSARARWTSRLALILLFFCFWSDGAFCLLVNLLLPAMSAARLDALQITWRLCSQPLHWLLMMLLAGWLLDAVVATWADWRRETGHGSSR